MLSKVVHVLNFTKNTYVFISLRKGSEEEWNNALKGKANVSRLTLTRPRKEEAAPAAAAAGAASAKPTHPPITKNSMLFLPLSYPLPSLPFNLF